MDAAETAKERAAAERRLAETPWVAWEDAIKLQREALPLSDSDALALAAGLDSRSEAGALDPGAMADPDAVRAVVAGEAEPPMLQPPQQPDIDLGAMPMHAGRAEVPVATVAAAAAPPAEAASPAVASPARPMAPPPQARHGFDADANAQADAARGGQGRCPNARRPGRAAARAAHPAGTARSAAASSGGCGPGDASAPAHGALKPRRQARTGITGRSTAGWGASPGLSPPSHPLQPWRCRPFFIPRGDRQEPGP
ncbi:hypothetical protein [Azohydromonas australica]|uniref:hypothetical protein n=1 Tax=Azohydromonas australica TaxID=364039 RepID=UPI0012EC3079|nr:hypothetical protein [Azohydromonas australica]